MNNEIHVFGGAQYRPILHIRDIAYAIENYKSMSFTEIEEFIGELIQMKVIVFGASGMLGHKVYQVLKAADYKV